jgi:carbonic anhydrase/acetyltransferase-like protein (isoleucine patch superfamily)
MSTIHLEARSSIGTRAIVLYDTVVGEDVSLAMLSLVMKGEHLLPATAWHGIPAQTAERRAHLEPDWTVTGEPGQHTGVHSPPVEPRLCDV